MQVVIEVIALPAVLCLAKGAWLAFTITADATDVTAVIVSEENVGAKIDMLSGTLQAAAGNRQPGKIDCGVDRDENVGIMRDCFCGC
jgi:hypothetical protein